MTYLCVLAVLLTLPVTATAQQRRSDDHRSNDRSANARQSGDRAERGRGARDADDRSSRDRPDRTSNTKRNPTTPSWEQKQLPWWERQGAPWWERGQSRPPASDINRNKQHDNRYRGQRFNNGGVVYVMPSYPYFEDATTTGVTLPPPAATVIARPAPASPPPDPAVGFLYLYVEPRLQLQIYVDDVFIGTPADLGDELRLSAGTRRVELRARGYKTLTFSAEIVENRSINFRGTLERDPSAPSTEAVTAPPIISGQTTMYMIRGCYLGNVAPKASELRPGCDIVNLMTFKP